MSLKMIGEGGEGIIYLSDDGTIIKRVKMKSPDRIKKFLEKAEAAAAVSGHPNICRIYEYGKDGMGPYVRMEYLGAVHLSKYIREKGGQTRLFTDKFISKIKNAIAYANTKGVSHCDLRPRNIMMLDREPKIVDFGIFNVTAKAKFYDQRFIYALERYLRKPWSVNWNDYQPGSDA